VAGKDSNACGGEGRPRAQQETREKKGKGGYGADRFNAKLNRMTTGLANLGKGTGNLQGGIVSWSDHDQAL